MELKKIYFIFAHSYHVTDCDTNNIIATTNHEYNFPAIVNFKNVYGVQFHPEKSYSQGRKLINNFIQKC